MCFSFACTSGGCATTWIAHIFFDCYYRNTYKFIIIRIVVMRTCAHCAILCTALACTEEDCVIHTIVLLRRVGGTQKEILRNDRANKSNDVTPTMKRVTSLTQKHITLWKFVITQGVFQHSQFSVCVRSTHCVRVFVHASFLFAWVIQFLITHRTVNERLPNQTDRCCWYYYYLITARRRLTYIEFGVGRNRFSFWAVDTSSYILDAFIKFSLFSLHFAIGCEKRWRQKIPRLF